MFTKLVDWLCFSVLTRPSDSGFSYHFIRWQRLAPLTNRVLAWRWARIEKDI